MEWKHKNVVITIEDSGKFKYTIDGNTFRDCSLYYTKKRIDGILKNYYVFSKEDVDNLLKKLDDRETEFVSSLIKEIKEDRETILCEFGKLDNKLFDID